VTAVEQVTIAAKVSPDVRAAFAQAAARRGISVYRLVSELLVVIADDDMFDAVLDDVDPLRPA
jgi:hypothetical protein